MSQPLIFITGATGFIGSHVVSQSLAAGYRVRLSVRKESQISTLRKLFSAHTANLDFAVIPDFVSPDRFSKALEDVTYVFHLASPMPGTGSDFQTDYLEPAVQGTIALLDAAKKVDTIKRTVIVSSALALLPLVLWKTESSPLKVRSDYLVNSWLSHVETKSHYTHRRTQPLHPHRPEHGLPG